LDIADDLQVFFVVLRESLEAGIIVSVLLAFIKKTLGGPEDDPKVYKKLVRQVRFLSLAHQLHLGSRPFSFITTKSQAN
jgi:high-affinity Fe2+/Pb2+ permease